LRRPDGVKTSGKAIPDSPLGLEICWLNSRNFRMITSRVSFGMYTDEETRERQLIWPSEPGEIPARQFTQEPHQLQLFDGRNPRAFSLSQRPATGNKVGTVSAEPSA
jgi:hypothetical protein